MYKQTSQKSYISLVSALSLWKGLNMSSGRKNDIYHESMNNKLKLSFQHTGAVVYGTMSFLDKLSGGAVVMLIQYFQPCKNEV